MPVPPPVTMAVNLDTSKSLLIFRSSFDLVRLAMVRIGGANVGLTTLKECTDARVKNLNIGIRAKRFVAPG